MLKGFKLTHTVRIHEDDAFKPTTIWTNPRNGVEFTHSPVLASFKIVGAYRVKWWALFGGAQTADFLTFNAAAEFAAGGCSNNNLIGR
jgi:hypothetical protein